MCRQKFPNSKVFPKNYSIIEYADSSPGPYQRPSTLSVASQDAAEDGKPRQTRMCPVHPHKKIKYFCLNCEEPICSKCFTLTHIRHVLEKPMNTRKDPVSRYMIGTELKQRLGKLAERCQELQFEANFAIREAVIQRQKIQRARQDQLRCVEQTFDNLVRAIEHRRSRLIETLESRYVRLESEVRERVKRAREQAAKCEGLSGSLVGFMRMHGSELVPRTVFPQDERKSNILVLNHAANAVVQSVEKGAMTVQTALDSEAEAAIVPPEFAFNCRG